ncbi:hypothetical protein MUK42_28233 [Musa troglodytarum]|uniref:RRM domain-containing protein n=1 Tax=Musa troglodytarum TaxID=320322 RepID=A0A9E7JPZ9_9LILI|nr:hypothetical protein MUK42_28233 [Musa troglodytarum]
MKRRGKGERPKSDAFPASLSKRLRRPPPTEAAEGEPAEATAAASPSVVLVTGLPADCTVLELKSRLEIYGPISRTRIDVDGRGFVTFRSDHAAAAAISASLDPAFGVTVRSKKSSSNFHGNDVEVSFSCQGWWSSNLDYLDAPMMLEGSLKEVVKEMEEKSRRSVQWRFAAFTEEKAKELRLLTMKGVSITLIVSGEASGCRRGQRATSPLTLPTTGVEGASSFLFLFFFFFGLEGNDTLSSYSSSATHAKMPCRV